MTRFVIDAQTLIHVLESGRPIDPSHQLVAPASIRSQALDLLLSRVGQGELSEAEALALHEQLTAVKLRLLNDRVCRRTAWDIARARGWTSIRQAEHLALVKLQADALLTIEDELIAAADATVPVAALEQLFRA